MPNLSGSNTGTQNMVENSNHSVTLSGDMGIRDAKKLISELKIIKYKNYVFRSIILNY